METGDGPIPMSTSYTWKRMNGASTLMRLRNHGEPRGFSVLLKPIISWMMKIANRKDLRNIKRILENNNDLAINEKTDN